MTVRALAVILALSVALVPTARAQDAGTAEHPGRAVDLKEGQPAPYAGALLDRPRLEVILARRTAAELERDALRLEVTDARARQQAAEGERGSRVSWGVLLGVTGAALVLGVVGGVALVYAARK